MPLLLSAYILFNSPAMLIEYIYLINNRPRSILIYAIVIFSLQIAAVGLPPLFGFGLNEVIVGLLAVTVVKFVWLLFVIYNYSKAKLDERNKVKENINKIKKALEEAFAGNMEKINNLKWP